MTQHNTHFHGSDLETIEKVYGIKKEDIVSFVCQCKSLGYFSKTKDKLGWAYWFITRYPDREYTSLRQHIAGYVQADVDHIIVGNGSTELISLFIQIKT